MNSLIFLFFLFYICFYGCDSTSIHESENVDLAKIIVDYSLNDE
jgi:hypothetical protein